MTIGFQKTPGRPTEVVFAAELGLPNDNQELLLIGRAASGATGTETVITMNSVSDVTAATTEANLKFGEDSELAKMVIAAVKANAAVGNSNFPPIKCVPLESDATEITEEAVAAVLTAKAEFVVSPFDAQTDSANLTTLKETCATMSGASRVQNNQFGTIGVAANTSVEDPSTLETPDTQYLSLAWFRNTETALTVGEIAAAYAAILAGNGAPFNPLDGNVIGGIDGASLAEKISVGVGLESEIALTQGWTPLSTKPNGDVSIVRSTTTRITLDGTIAATAYYDVQDYQVLYYFRKAIVTRESQPDFRNVKASTETAKKLRSEIIRIMGVFETNTMFQAVAELSKSVTVSRSTSDRHRFDTSIPTNVVPGLHVIANTILATTEFDNLTL